MKALENQSLRNDTYEVIVASDGPDAETQKAMQHWLLETDLNAQYIPGTEKAGPAATRNRGWLSAQSPLIAFTDDDCLPDKDWLSSLLKRYQGEALIAFSGTTRVYLPACPSDFALNLSKLGDASFITANCACTKEALISVGGFDEQFKMAWREDSDLEFKLISHQITIQKIPDAVVVHPVHRPRWGISVFEQKKGIYDALLFKKFPKLYRNYIGTSPVWIYYLTVLFFTAFLYSIFITFLPGVVIYGLSYLVLLLALTFKRLKNTDRAANHIFEMVSTSVVIPFLSIYYRWYGAIKFRIFFV